MDERRVEDGLRGLAKAELRPEHVGEQVQSVLQRLQSERRRSPEPSRWFWVAVPLAAAAALLVWLGSPFTPEPAVLALPGGVYLNLDPGSKLQTHVDEGRLDLELLEGGVSVRLAHDHVSTEQDRLLAVRVLAGDTQVLAVGTIFSVRRTPDDVRVEVLEGTVRVGDGRSEATAVHAGESLIDGELRPLEQEAPALRALAALERRRPGPLPPLPSLVEPNLDAGIANSGRADVELALRDGGLALEDPTGDAGDADDAGEPDLGARRRRRPRAAWSPPRVTPEPEDTADTGTSPDATTLPPAPDAGSGVDRERRWREARAGLAIGDVEAAKRHLAALRASKDPVWAPLATMEEARLHVGAGEAEAARARLQEFLRSWPGHPLVPEARNLLCRLAPEGTSCP